MWSRILVLQMSGSMAAWPDCARIGYVNNIGRGSKTCEPKRLSNYQACASYCYTSCSDCGWWDFVEDASGTNCFPKIDYDGGAWSKHTGHTGGERACNPLMFVDASTNQTIVASTNQTSLTVSLTEGGVPVNRYVSIMTADDGAGHTEPHSGHYLSMCRQGNPKNAGGVGNCEKFVISSTSDGFYTIEAADDGAGHTEPHSGHYLSMCRPQSPKNAGGVGTCEKFIISATSAGEDVSV